MTSLYSVTLFAAAMAVLCALLETMIPQGRLKSTVLLALGIVFLLALAAPIADLVRQQPAGLTADSSAGEAGDTLGSLPTHEELLKGYFEDSMANPG